MTSTTLEPSRVPADRLAHGYRWEDEQWKDEPLLPDGAFGSMGGMLTSIRDLGRYVGAFLAAWPPRDGPETGPSAARRCARCSRSWRPRAGAVTRDRHAARLQLNAGRLRLRARRLADLRLPAHRRAQRRAAGVRHR